MDCALDLIIEYNTLTNTCINNILETEYSLDCWNNGNINCLQHLLIAIFI